MIAGYYAARGLDTQGASADADLADLSSGTPEAPTPGAAAETDRWPSTWYDAVN